MQKRLTDYDEEIMIFKEEIKRESIETIDDVIIPDLTPRQFADKKQKTKEQHRADPEIQKNKRKKNKGLI